MTSLDRRALRAGTVPGWVIDRVLGDAGGCVIVSACAAAAADPASPARFATIALAPADDVAAHETLAGLAARDHSASAEVLDTSVGACAVLAMVLPATIGVADAPRAATPANDHLAFAPAPNPAPAPPPSPAPTIGVSNDAEAARRNVARPRRRFAVAVTGVLGAAVVPLAAIAWLGHGSGAASADAPPQVAWDEATATATVHTGTATQRFALGEPGDQLLVGDWDGDGRPSPALYRPSTGDVWVFDRWVDGDAPATARWSARHVTGGRAIVVATDHGDEIAVRPA